LKRLAYPWAVIAAATAMVAGGCVSLKVVDYSTGLPVAGAEVTYSLRAEEGFTSAGRTDSRGLIQFPEPVSLNVITVSKQGYVSCEKTYVWLTQNSSKSWGPVEIRLVRE
jgi:hypothetical protein